MTSKELRAQRAKLIEDARALLAQSDGAEAQAKFDEMLGAADALKERIDRVERADAELKELAEARHQRADREGVSRDHREDKDITEKTVFAKYLRGGFQAMNAAEHEIAMRHMSAVPAVQAALGVGTGAAGGFTVPQAFYDEVMARMVAFGGVRTVARVISTDGGNALPVPAMDDIANVAVVVAEGTQITTDTDPTFSQVTLNAFMYTSNNVRVSYQLMQDSAFDIEAMIRDAISVRFARGMNAHYTTGTGTGQAQGLANASVGTTIGRTGATGNATSISYAELLQAAHMADPAYRANARWMFNDSTLRVFRSLVDSQNRPLWDVSVVAGAPDTLMGYPYVINQDMPSMAANARSIAFGDFSAHYIVRDVRNLQVLRLTERFADFLQVGFLAFMRSDGRIVSAPGTQAVRLWQNSAT